MSSVLHPYPSDISEEEWRILTPLIPSAKPGDRPRKWPMHKNVNGVFYVVRTGCQWRLLPHDLHPWSTVHHYLRLWRLDGTWEKINAVLRERIRVRGGRDPQPTAAILDTQSVKTTSVGGVRGYDGAKQLSGRKRHLQVDTLGMVLKARVHAADLQDRAAVPLALEGAREEFQHLWVDQRYTGAGKAWIEEHLGWSVEVVKHPPKARGEWQPRGDLNDL
jgi:putative transposase